MRTHMSTNIYFMHAWLFDTPVRQETLCCIVSITRVEERTCSQESVVTIFRLFCLNFDWLPDSCVRLPKSLARDGRTKEEMKR
jgi:hypothetical protein